MEPCKLVIVGEGAVGKSALTMRFMYAEVRCCLARGPRMPLCLLWRWHARP